MKKLAFTRKSTYLVALAALLIASFVAGTLATSNQPVDAQDVNPLDAAAPVGAITIVCTIGNIATSNDLVVLYCPAAPPPIKYFAYPTTSLADARIASRYLATLFTAYALGKPAITIYDDDPTHNPSPLLCSATNCRLILGLGF